MQFPFSRAPTNILLLRSMATFSWSDTARAVFGSCLPCLPSSERHDTSDVLHQGSRRDELESLLQSAEHSDAEMDVDALSLHSRIGQRDGRRRSSRKKRGRNKGSISLFGFDLFGRPLRSLGGEEDQDSDREHNSNQRISRISSSTLDSDAAPLADDAIPRLSAQTQARREEDEAREARKARKRMRKAAKLAPNLDEHGDEFEGFPGSGPTQDDFGAFQEAHSPAGAESSGESNADFDAGSYVRTAVPRSDSGSGTRSPTSASVSNTSDPVRAYQVLRLHPSSPGPVSPAAPSPKPKSKRSKKSGKRSATTVSSSASQPRSPTDTAYIPRIDIASPTFEGFPEDDTFEGVPGGNVSHAFSLKLTGESVHGDSEGNFSNSRGLPVPGLPKFPSQGLGRSNEFPSRALGERKNSLSMSGKGVFLARTGDDA